MTSLRTFFLRWGTPATVGLFIVSTVSGVALFLHLGSSWFHSMHEILSMVLLLPVVVHVWRNWGGFRGYLRKGSLATALGLSLVASLGFASASAFGGSSGGNPVFAVTRTLGEQPLSVVAPAFGLTIEEAAARLEAAGTGPAEAGDTIAALAAAGGSDTVGLVAALAAPATD